MKNLLLTKRKPVEGDLVGYKVKLDNPNPSTGFLQYCLSSTVDLFRSHSFFSHPEIAKNGGYYKDNTVDPIIQIISIKSGYALAVQIVAYPHESIRPRCFVIVKLADIAPINKTSEGFKCGKRWIIPEDVINKKRKPPREVKRDTVKEMNKSLSVIYPNSFDRDWETF